LLIFSWTKSTLLILYSFGWSWRVERTKLQEALLRSNDNAALGAFQLDWKFIQTMEISRKNILYWWHWLEFCFCLVLLFEIRAVDWLTTIQGNHCVISYDIEKNRNEIWFIFFIKKFWAVCYLTFKLVSISRLTFFDEDNLMAQLLYLELLNDHFMITCLLFLIKEDIIKDFSRDWTQKNAYWIWMKFHSKIWEVLRLIYLKD